jgi:hypothetical protein
VPPLWEAGDRPPQLWYGVTDRISFAFSLASVPSVSPHLPVFIYLFVCFLIFFLLTFPIFGSASAFPQELFHFSFCLFSERSCYFLFSAYFPYFEK